MIKRPLNACFRDAVLTGKKTTTIRDKPWPTRVPIMLYHWSGAPYRSKQTNVAQIVVIGYWTIRITHKPDGDMLYSYGRVNSQPLHESEGFASRADMDKWFRPLVQPGYTAVKALMLFRLETSPEKSLHTPVPPHP